MKKIITLFFGALLLSTTACDQFLDVKSHNRQELATYFTTYDECRAATAPLYNKVWYDFSSQFYFDFGDGRGNNLFTPYSTAASFIRLTETIETAEIQSAW